MRRDWRDDTDRRAIIVKWHDDLARMQMQRRSVLFVFARSRTVDRVAESGPTHRGAMNAKLMRASRQRFEREPGELMRCAATCWARSLPP
jgi:hypothetical protein